MHGTSPGEATVPLATFGGLVTLAPAETLPEGASPRTWNADYNVGQAKTRDGLTNVYNQSNSSVGPSSGNAASSEQWSNTSALLSSSSGYASFSPASAVNSAAVTRFSFALPSADSVTGIKVTLTGYSNTLGILLVQIISNGVAIATKSIGLDSTVTNFSVGSLTDLWGLVSLPVSIVNSGSFGIEISLQPGGGFTGATAFAKNIQVEIGVNTGQQTMQPFSTFTDQNGLRYNLVLDQAGNLWVEELDSAPDALAITRTGIAPGSLAVMVQGEGVEYMAFVKPGMAGGSDMPLQWSPEWTDRITQVGPGAAPTFTPSQASDTSYDIASITQPAGHTQGFSYYLQSQGPGSTAPGNVVTFYYLDSTVAPGPNEDLVNAFNSGNPVYLWATFTGGGGGIGDVNFGPLVVLVTSVGKGQPPGQPRQYYYFTFNVSTIAYNFTDESSISNVAAYQRSLATLTTTAPVPNLLVGSQMVVTGVTPSGWNNTWTVTQTPNASEMVITGSVVSGGIATFNYAVTNDTANPAAGQIVIITNTLNGGGGLNGTFTIVSASGGATGTFTIAVSLPGFSFEAENGFADTEGTIFDFDPGAALLGTDTDPIFGNAGAGGAVVFNASGVFVDPGTYQGTAFFILRDGSYTFPAPPVVFTVPDNTTQLIVGRLPIGPPNVVGRGIAITEAGQNGVPGANFFTLPDPVIFYVKDVKQTATSFFVNDNTTISTTLFFTSAILNEATAIDIYGYNLFNLIEIGDPVYVSSYDSRNCYGQCLNKIQNLVNMSFDGGYLQSPVPLPLGWSQPQYGSLTVSPIFGNAYYISNSGSVLAITSTVSASGVATYGYTATNGNNPQAGNSVIVTGTTNGSGAFNLTGTITSVDIGAGTFTVNVSFGDFSSASESGQGVATGTLTQAGLIQQTAYQDASQVDILNTNTGYSVRVTARCPSGITTEGGSLVIALEAGSGVLGTYTLPLSDLSTSFSRFIGVLLADPGLTTIPANVMLQVYAANLPSGADIEIDRIDVFPTDIPVLLTTEYWSYSGLPTMVDSVSGEVLYTSENQHPVQAATVLYDTHYVMKGWTGTAPGSSLYSLQSNSSLEPANWDEPEVSQRSGGGVGPFAWAGGEQWFVAASRAGLFLFVGGQPGKIMQEVQQVWDAVNWNAAASIWVDINLKARRLMVGLPLPTPNFWLPFAPENSAPTSPNVVLMLNFQGLDSGEELRSGPQMHTTMFGKLAALDMRRKWSLWYGGVESPYATTVQGVDGEQTRFGNGQGNSKVYYLDPTQNATDDGVAIDSGYTTAGLPLLGNRAEMPQLGPNRVQWEYLVAALTSGGLVNIRLLANRLFYPEPANYRNWTIPGGFAPGLEPLDDTEASLNFIASRTFFEFRQNDGNPGWTLSNLVLRAKKAVWNAMLGRK